MQEKRQCWIVTETVTVVSCANYAQEITCANGCFAFTCIYNVNKFKLIMENVFCSNFSPYISAYPQCINHYKSVYYNLMLRSLILKLVRIDAIRITHLQRGCFDLL